MEFSYEGIALAPIAWALVSMLRDIAQRAGISQEWVDDLSPVLAIVFCVIAAKLYVTPDWSDAVLFGVVMGVTAAGLHDVKQHAVQRATGQR